MARDTFPELAEFLNDGLLDSLAAQLDAGRLETVIAAAEQHGPPPLLRDVLRMVVVAGEDQQRRRPANGSSTSRPEPPVTSRPEPPVTSRPEPPVTSRPEPPVSSRPATAAPGPPVSSRPAAPSEPIEERQAARHRFRRPGKVAGEDPVIIGRSGGDGGPSTAGRSATPAAPEPSGPAETVDVAELGSSIDAFDVSGGELQAFEQDGEIALSWDPRPAGAGVVVYLIVASADGPPDSLQGVHRLVATTGTRAVVPAGSGPYFAVFAYPAESIAAAREVRGCPHGHAALLPEVKELTATPSSDEVIVRWTRPPGVGQVQVMRSLPNQRLPDRFDPALAVIPSGDVYRDSDVLPGATYHYRVQALQGAGGRPSRGVEVPAAVAMRLLAVNDLAARLSTERGHDPRVTLTYTAPRVGEVVIYEAIRQPVEVADNQSFELSRLTALNLGNPIMLSSAMLDEQRRELPNVPFSTKEATARFYTPVTMGTDEFIVGRTVAVHHVGPVDDMEVIDRVDYQILRFAWPVGARSIVYLIGPPGASDDETGRPVSVNQEEFSKLGGVKLPLLPDTGARLFVRGERQFGSKRYFGPPSSVDYAGRVRLDYRFESVGSGRTLLQVWAERGADAISAVVLSNPHSWIPSRVDGEPPPPGTSTVQVSSPLPVLARTWTTVGTELTLPPGFHRVYFSLHTAGVPAMVVDPLPAVGAADGRSLAESAAAVGRAIKTVRGVVNRPAPPTEPVPVLVRCPTCLGQYRDDVRAVRCPKAGTCGKVADTVAAQFRQIAPVETEPVHVLTVARDTPETTSCPSCNTAGATPVCPLCHSELPPHWPARDNLAFTFIGARATGKTICMTVMQRELAQRLMPSIGRSMYPLNQQTEERAAKFAEELYVERLMTFSTQGVEQNPDLLDPLLYDLGPGRSGTLASLTLFDVAGEALIYRDRVGRYAHMLTRSDCVVFLIDVTQISQVRDRLEGMAKGYMDLGEQTADPGDVLLKVAATMRDALNQPTGKLPIRMAIVLSKLDGMQQASRDGIPGMAHLIEPGSILVQDPYLDSGSPLFVPGDSELVHLETMALLRRLGAMEFMTRLETNFSNYRFFASSALGHGPIGGKTLSDAGVNSYRLCDPIRWAMSEKAW